MIVIVKLLCNFYLYLSDKKCNLTIVDVEFLYNFYLYLSDKNLEKIKTFYKIILFLKENDGLFISNFINYLLIIVYVNFLLIKSDKKMIENIKLEIKINI